MGDNTEMGETGMMERATWLSVLARAPVAGLEAALGPEAGQGADWVRPPEIGMVMMEGRAGGTGGRFSLGQATVTRATVAQAGRVGVGYVRGHDPRHAELMALADLALQAGDSALMQDFVRPEAARQQALRDDRARAAAASKVEFFTMARESSAGGA